MREMEPKRAPTPDQINPEVMALAANFVNAANLIREDLIQVVDELVRIKSIELATHAKDLSNMRVSSAMEAVRDLAAVLTIANSFRSSQTFAFVPNPSAYTGSAKKENNL